MALSIGNAEGNTGLAGALKTTVTAAFEEAYGAPPEGTEAAVALGMNALCDGLAAGIVAYLVANAEVAVTVGGEAGTGTLS